MRVKDEIVARLKQGQSYKQIARELGCSNSTISFHANRIGHEPLRPSANNRYDWEEVQNYYEAGHSRTECVEKFGFAPQTWSKAKKDGRLILNREWRIPLSELLVSDRPQTGRKNLKNRLIKDGILANVCSGCGLTSWMGKPIILELDHINGKETDNRLQNLRLLCPNCHSQTLTYCNKTDIEDE